MILIVTSLKPSGLEHQQEDLIQNFEFCFSKDEGVRTPGKPRNDNFLSHFAFLLMIQSTIEFPFLYIIMSKTL